MDKDDDHDDHDESDDLDDHHDDDGAKMTVVKMTRLMRRDR